MMDARGLICNGMFRVSSLSLSDVDEVMAIESVSFPHPWSRDLFLSEAGRTDISRCFIARVVPDRNMDVSRSAGSVPDPGTTGEVAGYLMAWLVMDELYITNLAAALEYRRSGVATGLLEHAMRDAMHDGASWCQLEVRASNYAARALYEKSGFHRVGLRKRYYQNGEDAIVMGKDLRF